MKLFALNWIEDQESGFIVESGTEAVFTTLDLAELAKSKLEAAEAGRDTPLHYSIEPVELDPVD